MKNLEMIPDPPILPGALIKNADTDQCGVVIATYFFDDDDAHEYNESWLIKVLVDEKIEEGWYPEWDDWDVIN